MASGDIPFLSTPFTRLRRIRMAHPIVHIELASSDPKATGKFLGDLFGWPIETDPNFDYVQFTSQEGFGGGFPAADGQMYQPGEVIVYVQTDDIEQSLARVEELGGRSLGGKQEIPGIGWFAFFSDPSGVKMALYKSIRSQGQS
jgi:predicted enzyme related to lactoylglutathione lyase